jgi:hypothetical protein
MVTEKYPKVNIVTTWVDECLDEEGVCVSHHSALRAASLPPPPTFMSAVHSAGHGRLRGPIFLHRHPH